MFKRLAMIVWIGLITVGCASNDTPIASDPTPRTDSNPRITREADQSAGGHFLWGYFEWTIDTAAETFEAVPLRSSDLHLNVSKFLDGPSSFFSFSGFNLDKDTSTISLDVGITHPFPAKPNLAGFDVRGILIGGGSWTGFDDPSIVAAGPGETRLLNADGWTRWWNPVEFQIGNNIFSYRDGRFGIKNAIGNYNCTLNGYKIFADDLGKNEHPDGLSLADRAVFSPGSTNVRRYEIWFPQQDNKFVLRYNYAVDASWEPIPGYKPGDPVEIPGDYPASANMPEPFRIDFLTEYDSLYFVDSSTRGGSSVHRIRVFDWQGYLAPGDIADEVAGVKLECPGCIAGSHAGTLVDPGSGSQAYAEYEIVIDGNDLTSNEDCDALITVSSANGDYQPALTGYTGTAPLASYEFFPFAEISPEAPPPNEPPTANAEADVTNITVGDTVTFDASGSTDDDGIIVSYEWDFDGDGVYGDPYDGGTDVQPQKIFNQVGIFNVDLMVTDDDGADDKLNQPIKITVNPVGNLLPVAVATANKTEVFPGEQISFNGTGSYDPDGIIVSWEWDFDGDGTYGDPYDAGIDQAPVVAYDEVGQYDVDLLVTDDDGATDVLDNKIRIYVVSPENDPPIACAEIVTNQLWEDDPIEFDASCSYDPDGTVVDWLWDFNADGLYGDPIDGGTPENPLKAFGAGQQTVDLKVIDNGGKADYLDEPLEFFVESHVIITLPEDQDYKSANGYEYFAMSCVTPEDIPVDYTDSHGPWDFTGLEWLPDPDLLLILPPDHSEVLPYADKFPVTTQYYTRYDVHGAGTAGYLYMPEEADLVNNILYVYGHVDKKKGSSTGGAVSYSEAEGGPVALTYPWSVFTDEDWVLTIYGGGQPFVVLTYREVGIGEGDATVPFGGGWTTRTLLTRSFFEFRIAGQVAAQIILYKWTADDGRQIARLYAVNTPDETNFNEVTYEIIGTSRLTALSSEF